MQISLTYVLTNIFLAIISPGTAKCETMLPPESKYENLYRDITGAETIGTPYQGGSYVS